MCSLSVTTATISNASGSPIRFSIPCYLKPNTLKSPPFPHKQQRKFVIFTAKDDTKLGNWEQMELQFGKITGENRKLTLAKRKDRNLNSERDEGNLPKEALEKAPNPTRHSVPNVILWKATSFEEYDDGTKMSSTLSLKPNLSLKMGNEEGKERFSDMILVRNLEPFIKNIKVESTVNIKEVTCQTKKVDQAYGDQNRLGLDFHDTDNRSRTDATLQGRPKRIDQHVDMGRKRTRVNDLIGKFVTSENLPPIPLLKGREDMDWKRADDMIKTTGRGEVEMISCSSTHGFVVSFGSLIGFLPYRNLANKWKYLAFESWLRKKGLDPATYKNNLGNIGNYDATIVDWENIDGEISPHMKLEDLLAIYDQEKLEYLSTFAGQKIKVNVILADRESKRLVFSMKPKEKEESVQRKRTLMGRLNVGDTVTCCVRKISYFGVFVEIEGVPALIHQTEVSWDSTLNPASSFKIGQVLEAKVHQLDFSLERISLSLKEITPDLLTESLETVLGDDTVLDGTVDTKQHENEWADLELLVKGLQRYEGIELVSKGQFFLSPGLTPSFQVYMASLFKNQYKLLARAGNKAQEVVVQTRLGTEEMKHVILMCTNRVM